MNVPLNPLVRLREELGFTQAQFAREIGMSRQGYLKNENGEYPNISEPILNYYQVRSSIDPLLLSEQYTIWQHEQRIANSPSIVWPDHPLPPIPVAVWRVHYLDMTPSEFAKFTCTSMTALARMEDPINPAMVSRPLKAALRTMGATAEQLSFLEPNA